jgi:hypothetical protein
MALQRQVRPVLPGFFSRLFFPPAPDFFVIASEQNFRHGPAAEFRGAGVVGKVEEEAMSGD